MKSLRVLVLLAFLCVPVFAYGALDPVIHDYGSDYYWADQGPNGAAAPYGQSGYQDNSPIETYGDLSQFAPSIDNLNYEPGDVYSSGIGSDEGSWTPGVMSLSTDSDGNWSYSSASGDSSDDYPSTDWLSSVWGTGMLTDGFMCGAACELVEKGSDSIRTLTDDLVGATFDILGFSRTDYSQYTDLPRGVVIAPDPSAPTAQQLTTRGIQPEQTPTPDSLRAQFAQNQPPAEVTILSPEQQARLAIAEKLGVNVKTDAGKAAVLATMNVPVETLVAIAKDRNVNFNDVVANMLLLNNTECGSAYCEAGKQLADRGLTREVIIGKMEELHVRELVARADQVNAANTVDRQGITVASRGPSNVPLNELDPAQTNRTVGAISQGEIDTALARATAEAEMRAREAEQWFEQKNIQVAQAEQPTNDSFAQLVLGAIFIDAPLNAAERVWEGITTCLGFCASEPDSVPAPAPDQVASNRGAIVDQAALDAQLDETAKPEPDPFAVFDTLKDQEGSQLAQDVADYAAQRAGDIQTPAGTGNDPARGAIVDQAALDAQLDETLNLTPAPSTPPNTAGTRPDATAEAEMRAREAELQFEQERIRVAESKPTESFSGLLLEAIGTAVVMAPVNAAKAVWDTAMYTAEGIVGLVTGNSGTRPDAIAEAEMRAREAELQFEGRTTIPPASDQVAQRDFSNRGAIVDQAALDAQLDGVTELKAIPVELVKVEVNPVTGEITVLQANTVPQQNLDTPTVALSPTHWDELDAFNKTGQISNELRTALLTEHAFYNFEKVSLEVGRIQATQGASDADKDMAAELEKAAYDLYTAAIEGNGMLNPQGINEVADRVREIAARVGIEDTRELEPDNTTIILVAAPAVTPTTRPDATAEAQREALEKELQFEQKNIQVAEEKNKEPFIIAVVDTVVNAVGGIIDFVTGNSETRPDAIAERGALDREQQFENASMQRAPAPNSVASNRGEIIDQGELDARLSEAANLGYDPLVPPASDQVAQRGPSVDQGELDTQLNEAANAGNSNRGAIVDQGALDQRLSEYDPSNGLEKPNAIPVSPSVNPPANVPTDTDMQRMGLLTGFAEKECGAACWFGNIFNPLPAKPETTLSTGPRVAVETAPVVTTFSILYGGAKAVVDGTVKVLIEATKTVSCLGGGCAPQVVEVPKTSLPLPAPLELPPIQEQVVPPAPDPTIPLERDKVFDLLGIEKIYTGNETIVRDNAAPQISVWQSKDGATELEGLRTGTVDAMVSLKNSCNCNLTITGAAEKTGNDREGGLYSHANGYKFDVRTNNNPEVLSYVKSLQQVEGSSNRYFDPENPSVLYTVKNNNLDVTVYPPGISTF